MAHDVLPQLAETCHMSPCCLAAQLKTKINKQQYFIFLNQKRRRICQQKLHCFKFKYLKIASYVYFHRLTLKTISFLSIMWLIIWNLIGFKIKRFYWKWQHFLIRLQTNFNRKNLTTDCNHRFKSTFFKYFIAWNVLKLQLVTEMKRILDVLLDRLLVF